MEKIERVLRGKSPIGWMLAGLHLIPSTYIPARPDPLLEITKVFMMLKLFYKRLLLGLPVRNYSGQM